jgi:hypothetical protein
MYGRACCQVGYLRPGMAHDDMMNMTCAFFLHVILWSLKRYVIPRWFNVLPLADNAALESQVRRLIHIVSHRYRPSEFACCTYAAKARTARVLYAGRASLNRQREVCVL